MMLASCISLSKATNTVRAIRLIFSVICDQLALSLNFSSALQPTRKRFLHVSQTSVHRLVYQESAADNNKP